MKLKAIPYQSGYIFCDESAEIKESDYFYYAFGDAPEIVKCEKLSEGDPNQKRNCFKIIAQTTNLNLEGIPYVELEEDVEVEARRLCELQFPGNYPFDVSRFVAGYKAAQQKYQK